MLFSFNSQIITLPFKSIKPIYTLFLGEIKIGEHWYLNPFHSNNILWLLHGQVLITATLVCGIIIVFSISANQKLKPTPDGLQNASEYITEFIRDLTKQILSTTTPLYNSYCVSY